MEVVLDTNVVVSAIIAPTGPPGIILARARQRQFGWTTSRALLDELTRILRNKRTLKYTRWSVDQINELLMGLPELAKLVEPPITLTVVRDSSDNRVLEAALTGEVDYIVSGDRDLRDLGAYEGIPIVTPARFLAILQTG